MLSNNQIQPILTKISFIMMNTYFFFISTNFSSSIFIRSNGFLLTSLAILLLGFIFSVSFNLIRIISFSAVSLLMISNIIFYKFFPNGGHVDYDYELVYVIVFFIAMGSMKAITLIKISFYTQITLTVLTIVSFIFKLIPNDILYRYGAIRQSLGFAHPNLLGRLLMCLTFAYLYLYKEKINWIHLCFIAILNIGVYYITLSRTSFICAVMAIVCFVFYKYTKLFQTKIAQIILRMAFPVIFFLGVFLPMTYRNNAFYIMLNNFFSNRLIQGHYYLEKYGISLFGQPIPNIIKIYNPVQKWWEEWVVDSAYLRILIEHGFIVFFIIFAFIMLKANRLLKKGYSLEVCFILISLFYAFFERYSYNIFIFTAPLLLFVEPAKFESKINIYNIYHRIVLLLNRKKHKPEI